MKVLITGINGQDGSYMAEQYLQRGWDVYGTVRQRSDLQFISDIQSQIHLEVQDIRDPHGVLDMIRLIRPDVIHHLAAMTYVPYSWRNPLDTFETNVQGTINILEAARTLDNGVTVHFAGSSEEYGAVPKELTPIVEETPIHAASPYGISKYAGDLLCQQYHRSYGLRTMITRAFNHTSPRRGKHFLTMQVVTQALEIKHGLRRCFTLGNLEAIRDFSDARDVVDAYYAAVMDPNVKPGFSYNVCSEVGYSVQKIVEEVASLAGVSTEVEQDSARLRPSDCPVLLGSSQKFREATGWSPRHTLFDTLRWMLETLENEHYVTGGNRG